MKLKQILKDREMSQLELSRLTGIAANIICNICNDQLRPYPGWRKKISIALNMPEEEIF